MGQLHVILGAGAIGQTLANTLSKQGHAVRVVTRSGRRPPALSAQIEVCAADVLRPETTAPLCQGAAVIYHCVNPAGYHRWHLELMPLHRGIVACAEQAQVKLVVMDNLYMYGPTGGAPVRPDTPFNADGAGSRRRTRIEADAFLLDAHRSGRVRLAIARAADYFGPLADAQSFVGKSALQKALRGEAINVLYSADRPHSFSYLADIARTLAKLGEDDAALGRAWFVPNAEAVTVRQLVTMLCAPAGIKPKLRVARGPLVPLLGLLVPALRGISEMRFEWDEDYVIDHSDTTAQLGLTPTPLDAATRETLAWVLAQA